MADPSLILVGQELIIPVAITPSPTPDQPPDTAVPTSPPPDIDGSASATPTPSPTPAAIASDPSVESPDLGILAPDAAQ